MFQIARHALGSGGAFVKLVHLESDDFAVIVRYPNDGRYHHRYIGPDFYEAEDVFLREADRARAEPAAPSV